MALVDRLTEGVGAVVDLVEACAVAQGQRDGFGIDLARADKLRRVQHIVARTRAGEPHVVKDRGFVRGCILVPVSSRRLGEFDARAFTCSKAAEGVVHIFCERLQDVRRAVVRLDEARAHAVQGQLFRLDHARMRDLHARRDRVVRRIRAHQCEIRKGHVLPRTRLHVLRRVCACHGGFGHPDGVARQRAREGVVHIAHQRLGDRPRAVVCLGEKRAFHGVDRQRPRRDRTSESRDVGGAQAVVARAFARELQPREGHVLVDACVLVGVRSLDGRDLDRAAFRHDEAAECVVPSFAQRLCRVTRAVVGLVEACAALDGDRQLLRRDTARILELRRHCQRIVRLVRALEEQAVELDVLLLPCRLCVHRLVYAPRTVFV